MAKVKICHERSKLVDFLTQKTSFLSPKPASREDFGQKSQVVLSAEIISRQGESLKFSTRDMGKNPAFKGISSLFSKAAIATKIHTLESLSKKYDGAQKGIEVFKGLNIAETFIATTNIYSIPTMRGCRHACSHCYADAKPPIRNTDTHISSPLWEDFVDLVCGIKEFKRLIGWEFPVSSSEMDRVLPFWDSDLIATKMPDLKGGFHGIAEAVDLLYTKLRKPLLIDTAGWAIQDKWAQTQAEELARYIKENPDAIYYKEVNISLNPFSPLMEKCFALKNQGNIEGAEKMEEKYIDRMANVFLTFLGCEIHPFSKAHIDEPYSQKELLKLNRKISDRIAKKINQRGMSDLESLKLDNLNKSLLSQYIPLISPEGRGAQLFEPKEVAKRKSVLMNMSLEQKGENQIFKAPKLFDINGQVYLASDYEQIDTGIQLNFRNKDKKTAPFNNYIHQK